MPKPEDLVCTLGDGWKVSFKGKVLNVVSMEFVHHTLGSYISNRDLATRYAKAWLERQSLSAMYA